MSAKQVVLIGGGVRSGKSAFALRLAEARGRRRVFVATAEAGDAEMRDRIARHRAERGGDFETIEEPMAIPELIERLENVDVVVLDCLTLWLSNLLVRDEPLADIHRRLNALVAALARRRFDAVLVTNEVGMGVVPESRLGRAFRDLSGMAHQKLSAIANEIYFGALGTMLRLKPAPVAVMGGGIDG